MEGKKFKCGLVIGKFHPLHKGHKALFEFARNKVHYLKIIVLGHKEEKIPLTQRVNWVNETIKTLDSPLGITVKGIGYESSELNSSSESDVKSSQEWCDFLADEMSDIDVIIGSEPYIKYMAEYSNKNYCIFDQSRKNVSISASEIQKDPIKYWDYLVPAVKRSFAKHICICGTECSGKTTLATKLEKQFEYVTMIPEIGRCLVGNANTCEISTLLTVFRIHRHLLASVIQDPPTPIIVWDTDNITTLSYINYFFNYTYYNNISVPIANEYWFLENNIPYEKDISRLEKEESEKLKEHHIQMYKKYLGNGKLNFLSNSTFLYDDLEFKIMLMKNQIINDLKKINI